MLRKKREVVVAGERLQKCHGGIPYLFALNNFQIKLAQGKVKIISPPTAASANSASDLRKSDRVVPAFCIITSNKDFAGGAELTVLLMMDGAKQAAPCCTPAALDSWISYVREQWGEREEHFFKVFLYQPC